ncbi:hypothetical protein EVAR_81181_1 [Eumeta japonica]|uniref:Uncharacterized protein n=1 Tax=Eumeta variegata TaxID=151549 RepID=A0A4C1ULG7_EUMVA|nr:hypothetical protein EVAR_81181_1 [Eumeta japonica]
MRSPGEHLECTSLIRAAESALICGQNFLTEEQVRLERRYGVLNYRSTSVLLVTDLDVFITALNNVNNEIFIRYYRSEPRLVQKALVATPAGKWSNPFEESFYTEVRSKALCFQRHAKVNKFKNDGLLRLDVPDDKFDVIIKNETLDGILRRNGFLKRLRRRLTPKNRLERGQDTISGVRNHCKLWPDTSAGGRARRRRPGPAERRTDIIHHNRIAVLVFGRRGAPRGRNSQNKHKIRIIVEEMRPLRNTYAEAIEDEYWNNDVFLKDDEVGRLKKSEKMLNLQVIPETY